MPRTESHFLEILNFLKMAINSALFFSLQCADRHIHAQWCVWETGKTIHVLIARELLSFSYFFSDWFLSSEFKEGHVSDIRVYFTFVLYQVMNIAIYKLRFAYFTQIQILGFLGYNLIYHLQESTYGSAYPGLYHAGQHIREKIFATSCSLSVR